ncbi:MAG: hypothetical protein QNJ70_27090 [Xenococcaceae cyanobacterium MO_207.B15]|nr:hypothetical protein [Xenococcaceae cyanobacterium MO_207.B15]
MGAAFRLTEVSYMTLESHSDIEEICGALIQQIKYLVYFSGDIAIAKIEKRIVNLLGYH